MRSSRFILFFLTILFGVTAGLFLVWEIFPVQYANNPPASLRADYKTDYVLMVAEIYKVDGNLEAATKRLEFLKDGTPYDVSQNAIQTARQLNYNLRDLQQIVMLSEQLLQNPSAQLTPTGEP